MPVGSLDRWPDDYERGRPGWPRVSRRNLVSNQVAAFRALSDGRNRA